MGFEVGINEKLDFTLRCSALGNPKQKNKVSILAKVKIEGVYQFSRQEEGAHCPF